MIARHWDDVTAREAKELFADHVAAHPQRARDALDAFVSIGVERNQLDFSRASLEAVWPAVIEAYGQLPERAIPAGPDDVPYWVPFRVSFAEKFGRARCWTVSYVAAYFAETVLRNAPDAQWTIGNVKGQDGYRQPLLRFPSGAQMSVENVVSVILKRGIERANTWGERDAQPDALRRQYDLRMGINVDSPLDDPRPIHPVEDAQADEVTFDIFRFDDGSFHVVYALEDVDDETSDELDRLVDVIARGRAVKSAWREDREVIIVIAPQLSPDALEEFITESWARHRR